MCPCTNTKCDPLASAQMSESRLTDYGQVQLDVLGGRVPVVDAAPIDSLVLYDREIVF